MFGDEVLFMTTFRTAQTPPPGTNTPVTTASQILNDGKVAENEAAKENDAARQKRQSTASEDPNAEANQASTLSALMKRAAGKGGDISTINGASPTGQSANIGDISASQQVYGSVETRLPPPSTPAVNFNAKTVTSAQTFITNFNTAMDDALKQAGATSLKVRTGASGAETPATIVMPSTYSADGAPKQMDISKLSSDQLISAFLKLNINDPNESVETHNEMYEFSTNMRQLAIENAQKAIKNAQELQKEAQKYAAMAEMLGTIITIASIALTVFTLGSSLAAGAAIQAGVQTAVQEAGKQAVQSAVQAGAQNAVAAATQQAAQQGTQVTAQMIQDAAMKEATSIATDMAANASAQAIAQAGGQEALKAGLVAHLQPMIVQEMSTQVAASAATEATKQVFAEAGKQATAQITSAASEGLQGTINQIGQKIELGNGVSNLKTASAVVNAGGQVVSGGANYTAANKFADAKEMKLEGEKWQFQADQAQAMVENEADIINTIMESKNQTVDTVMQMTNASWASKQQLMAAAFAK